jgi:peptide/nickel transport system ATP-binding protein
VVRQFADTLTVLRRGEVVESGTVAEVFAAPRAEYTRRLIDSIPARGASVVGARAGSTDADAPEALTEVRA